MRTSFCLPLAFGFTFVRLASLPAVAIAAASLSVLGGCVGLQSANFKSSSMANLTHAAGMPVSVATENGRIVVEVVQRPDVQISAEVRAMTQERADTTEVVAERESSGRLRVSVSWPDGQRIAGEGCSITILLPDVNGLDLRTSNGPVTIRGCSGLATIVTSNGPVEVTNHAGEAKVKTSNGGVTVTDLAGPLNVDTSNGRIAATGIAGPVEVDTSNGSISIALADTASGPVDLRTSNGTVTFRPGGAFTGNVSISTSNGAIKLPAERGEVRVIEKQKTSAKLSYRMGPIVQPESTIRTSNGSVTIE